MPESLRHRNPGLSDEAIAWAIRMTGSPDRYARAAFSAWCVRSPAHAAAAREAMALLDGVGHTAVAAEHRRWVHALAPAPVPRFGRRAFLVGGAAAAMVAVAAGVIDRGVLGPPAGLLADQSTRVGQRRRLLLADGSRAWLNTASALALAFGERERRASVPAGEVLFDVMPQAGRPFLATCDDGRARAASGRFVLRRCSGHSVVTVVSGQIEVGNDAGKLALGPGQRVAFSRDVLGQAHRVDAEAATAWVRGKLIFNRQPLSAIADELGRYLASRVVVVGERLCHLRLSGVFDLDDGDALLQGVAELAGASIVRLPLLVLIR